MDMGKMGHFLAELRKERNWTQAELGEKLGVTNKTVSRWETGAYMPPVEMLEQLSGLYGMTINELLCGRRLSGEEYRENAEANLREALKGAPFARKEQQAFYIRKWRRDHLSTFLVFALGWAVLLVVLRLLGVGIGICGAVGGILAVLLYAVLNNRMMAYVEKHLYGGSWDGSGGDD